MRSYIPVGERSEPKRKCCTCSLVHLRHPTGAIKHGRALRDHLLHKSSEGLAHILTGEVIKNALLLGLSELVEGKEEVVAIEPRHTTPPHPQYDV